MVDKGDVHSMVQIFELVSLDAVLLMFIITPLFLAAMHFYTAPFKKRYTNKVQTLVVPLALVPFFFFTNIDIAILSALVFIQNGYIAWYQLDQEEFPNLDEDYEHEDDADYGDSHTRYRQEESTWLETIGQSFMGLGASMDFSGGTAFAQLSRGM